MEFVLDTDATLALLKLSLWQLLLDAKVTLHLTSYIARSELSSVWTSKLEPLARSGRIQVHDVLSGTDVWARRKTLIGAGADKGEAEAIAWAEGREHTTFVTCDKGARRHACEHRVQVIDLGDLAAGLVVEGIANELTILEKIAPWDDARQQQGRPTDWGENKTSLKDRIARLRAR